MHFVGNATIMHQCYLVYYTIIVFIKILNLVNVKYFVN